ncbi:hypothetical protein KH5H1_27310 [Corallococcus caeni]|nr:hypothetical protein KH5H1_27310 [Corallococcus sp. KH5-1]
MSGASVFAVLAAGGPETWVSPENDRQSARVSRPVSKPSFTAAGWVADGFDGTDAGWTAFGFTSQRFDEGTQEDRVEIMETLRSGRWAGEGRMPTSKAGAMPGATHPRFRGIRRQEGACAG